MEENKDLINNSTEISEETALEHTDNSVKAEDSENKKSKKNKNEKKKRKPRVKKLKNQALLKRGGYSVAITALVLAGLILFNWLIVVLSNRFNLEFDMSSQKINSISEENIDYIKSIEDEVNITVCAAEDTYADYMSYYAQYYNNAEGNTEYFEQTINLINKYAAYNDKIQVKFIDPQSTEFTEISTKYSSMKLSYGDIIVSSIKGENERNKKVTFEDIYSLSDESGYASYGYGSYTISGNNVETAVTSAVSYALSSESKKIGLITGHSLNDMTSSFVTLLEDNNYEITTISDQIISEIPDDCDIVAVLAPTSDFMGSELDAISDFLDNNGKLGKGFMYFADAANPYLPNLADFLSEWGIKTSEGILFETTGQYSSADDPTTMYLIANNDNLPSDVQLCVGGYNLPLSASEPADSSITVDELVVTPETVVAAPIGVSVGWKDYSDSDVGQYAGVVQAVKGDYDDDNNRIESYVVAFSTIDFISSEWAENSGTSNKDAVLYCTDTAAGVGESGISFISKTITDESFAESVTASGTKAIEIIFMIIIPVGMIVAGIYIYIRRKNA